MTDVEISGVGVVGIGHQDTVIGISSESYDPDRLAAVTPRTPGPYRVLLVLEDGSFLQVGEPVREREVP
ncbi:MAG: hypothetical protein U5R31_10485 [Acidimicrobiia bacterium]|nr:hypothetical protein [Acidimicrobiia bacterium]